MIYKHKKTGQFAVMITLDPQTAIAFINKSDHTCLVQMAGSMMVQLYTVKEFKVEFDPVGVNDTQATSTLHSSLKEYQNRQALVEEATKAFEATIDKHLSPMLSRIRSLEEKVTPYWQREQLRKSKIEFNKDIAQLRRDIEKQLEPLKQSHAARLTIGEKVGELFRMHTENVESITNFAKDVGANLRKIQSEVGMDDSLIIGGEETPMGSTIGVKQNDASAHFDYSAWDDYDDDEFDDDESDDEEYEKLYAVHAIGKNTQREYTYYTYADDASEAQEIAEEWMQRNGYFASVIGTQTISFLPPGAALIK